MDFHEMSDLELEFSKRYEADLSDQDLKEFISQLRNDRNVRAVHVWEDYLIVTLKKRKSRKPPPQKIFILHKIRVGYDPYVTTLENVNNVMDEYCENADHILESAVRDVLRDPSITGAARDFLNSLQTISYERLLKGIRTRSIQ